MEAGDVVVRAWTAPGGTPVLEVRGGVDIGNVQHLQEAIDVPVAEGRDVVLDLGELRFMGSVGAGVLLGAHQDLATAGARLHVVADGLVLRLITVVGLGSILALHHDLAAALAAAGAWAQQRGTTE